MRQSAAGYFPPNFTDFMRGISQPLPDLPLVGGSCAQATAILTHLLFNAGAEQCCHRPGLP